jgi:hypothetical protein
LSVVTMGVSDSNRGLIVKGRKKETPNPQTGTKTKGRPYSEPIIRHRARPKDGRASTGQNTSTKQTESKKGVP